MANCGVELNKSLTIAPQLTEKECPVLGHNWGGILENTRQVPPIRFAITLLVMPPKSPMTTSSEKSSSPPAFLSAQTVVILGIVWAVLALLFFLLFSVPQSANEELPLWYRLGTYIFELVAYLGASTICFRNWQSPQMVSGRNVWLGLGLGMLFYFIGGVLFGIWELYFKLDPDVSPADLFYIGSYIVLIWGMVLAVTSKRLNLEPIQWALLAGIAALGITIAVWIAAPTEWRVNLGLARPSTEQVAPTKKAAKDAAKTAPAIQESSSAPQEEEEEEEKSNAPSWVLTLNDKLEPYAKGVNLFYIVGDVFLLIIATALLLAFWGGRFSQSWRMIAAATFSLYIADMYFKWRDSQAGETAYQSGNLPEVFFVFSAILFGIGAVLEFDISTRSRQSRRSRRGSSAS